MITAIGSFMSPLDGSIVSVSLPTIASKLKIDAATVVWVPAAYIVALTVLLLGAGKLSDLRGRKSIFITGFFLFVVASFLCSISTSGTELVVSRVLEGVGGAFIAATAVAIVTDTFPPKERGKALGINVMSIYIALAVGPSLGGFLTYAFGWPSIFYVNIPIGIFVIILATLKLREPKRMESGIFGDPTSLSSAPISHSSTSLIDNPPPSGSPAEGKFNFNSRIASDALPPKKSTFDIPGFVAFSLGLVGLLVGLTMAGLVYPWESIQVLGLLTSSSVVLVFFVLFEARKTRIGNSQPLLDTSLFSQNRVFASANIAALVNYIAIFSATFLLSFYLQRALNFNPLYTGLLLMVMPVAMACLSPPMGALSDKIGSRVLCSSGMWIIALGMFVLVLASSGSRSGVINILIGELLLGVGMGLFSAPNTSTVMGSVERPKIGVASGTISTMRFLGQGVSLAMMGAIIAKVSGSSKILSAFYTGTTLSSSIGISLYTAGMKDVFLVSTAIAIVGGLVSLVRGKTVSSE